VVLSGGCFQNVRLLDTTYAALRSAEFNVLCHRDLPPNDGGLSAGQALGALWNITSVSSESAKGSSISQRDRSYGGEGTSKGKAFP
jgi:hydrogenase maturation protein HypF